MFERLEAIKERNDAITKELTKPEVISDVKKVTKLSKEQKELLQKFAGLQPKEESFFDRFKSKFKK